jgi:chitinase
MTIFRTLLVALALVVSASLYAQKAPPRFSVIAYYSGGPEKVDSIPAKKLTHIIYSFCHLKGNRLHVANARDSTTIHALVGLKKQNPQLKIILSLGGWEGCPTCSDVFSTDAGRTEFAQSVHQLSRYFHADGLDLDWEYPSIQGPPGHAFAASDKEHFTELLRVLRKVNGPAYELSFAAGGFQKYLEESVDWKAIMPIVDRVNLMTYDLVHGYSTRTGHHTPLYSNPGDQQESTDNCVQYLIKIGVPRNKLVIGAAFYGRIWENVADVNNGLFQSGKFKSFVDHRRFAQELTPAKGFKAYWDETAKAPYMYNAADKLFVTYDNEQSMKLKTEYAIDQKLDGIMFWEWTCDAPKDELLNVIDGVKRAHFPKAKAKK